MMFVQHVISYFQKITKMLSSRPRKNSETQTLRVTEHAWHKMLGFIHVLEQSFLFMTWSYKTKGFCSRVLFEDQHLIASDR